MTIMKKKRISQRDARNQELNEAKKFKEKTKKTIQSSREKHEQKQSYGRELRRSRSIDKLSANSKKGRSERTQTKQLIKEERLTHQASTQLYLAQEKIARGVCMRSFVSDSTSTSNS